MGKNMAFRLSTKHPQAPQQNIMKTKRKLGSNSTNKEQTRKMFKENEKEILINIVTFAYTRVPCKVMIVFAPIITS